MVKTKTIADLQAVYMPSEDLVARDIEGEIIILPLGADMGDNPNDIFTLNETGKVIWKMLDGKSNLREIMGELETEFSSLPEELENDLLGFVNELLQRKMLVEVLNNPA